MYIPALVDSGGIVEENGWFLKELNFQNCRFSVRVRGMKTGKMGSRGFADSGRQPLVLLIQYWLISPDSFQCTFSCSLHLCFRTSKMQHFSVLPKQLVQFKHSAASLLLLHAHSFTFSEQFSEHVNFFAFFPPAAENDPLKAAFQSCVQGILLKISRCDSCF